MGDFTGNAWDDLLAWLRVAHEERSLEVHITAADWTDDDEKRPLIFNIVATEVFIYGDHATASTLIRHDGGGLVGGEPFDAVAATVRAGVAEWNAAQQEPESGYPLGFAWPLDT